MDFPGCIICHECFTGKGSIVSTPCGHLFDDKCIRDWLIAHPLCPTCRKPVTVSDLKRLHLSFFGLSESKERMQLEKAKLKEEMQKEELLELSGQFKKMLLSMNGVQKHVERISSENEKSHMMIDHLNQQMWAMRGASIGTMTMSKNLVPNGPPKFKPKCRKVLTIKNTKPL